MLRSPAGGPGTRVPGRPAPAPGRGRRRGQRDPTLGGVRRPAPGERQGGVSAGRGGAGQERPELRAARLSAAPAVS